MTHNGWGLAAKPVLASTKVNSLECPPSLSTSKHNTYNKSTDKTNKINKTVIALAQLDFPCIVVNMN